MRLNLNGTEHGKDNEILKRHDIFRKAASGYTQSELSDVIRFVWHFTDSEDSPLADEGDIPTRLKKSVEMANIGSQRIKSACLGFFEGEGPAINWIVSIMSAYCAVANPTLYEDWFSSKINYHRMNKLLMQPLPSSEDKRETAAKSRLAIDEEKSKAAKRILLLEAELFKSSDVARKLGEKAMEEALASWAERYADEIGDGVVI